MILSSISCISFSSYNFTWFCHLFFTISIRPSFEFHLNREIKTQDLIVLSITVIIDIDVVIIFRLHVSQIFFLLFSDIFRIYSKIRLLVEGLTGKICIFLLAYLWLRYYYDKNYQELPNKRHIRIVMSDLIPLSSEINSKLNKSNKFDPKKIAQNKDSD